MANKKISDLPANAALDGTELYEASQAGGSVKVTGDAVRNGKVKVYRALLSQSGTNAPVATVLENTLGGTPVLSRNAQGRYKATLSGAFPELKTMKMIGQEGLLSQEINYTYWESDSIIQIISYSVADAQAEDDGLDNTSLEILVYP